MSDVIVYILTNDLESARVDKVKALFTNSLFTVNVVNIAPPVNLTTEEAQEQFQVSWILKNAKQQYPDNYVLIIKDSSISNLDSDSLANAIQDAISLPGWDVYYLCKWMDNCSLYNETIPIPGGSSMFYKANSPHGAQAILYSPHGRDVVIGDAPMKNGQTFKANGSFSSALNKAVAQGNINAIVSNPNLIDFDISANPRQGYKLNQCGGPNGNGSNGNGMASGISIWLFIIIIVALILLAWALLKVGPQPPSVRPRITGVPIYRR